MFKSLTELLGAFRVRRAREIAARRCESVPKRPSTRAGGGPALHRAECPGELMVRVNPTAPACQTNPLTGVMTPLDPADIRISGDEFTASVPLSLLLPAATRPPQAVDVQPLAAQRLGQNVQVSDLAPDDGNSPVQAVPEPGIADPVRDRRPRPARLRLAAEKADGIQVVTRDRGGDR